MQSIDYVARRLIIAEAKTWLGTSFHHQGRIKADYQHKGGCDCLGLIIGVAKTLNLRSTTGQLIANCDYGNYASSQNDLLASQLSVHLLDRGANIKSAESADVALFIFAKNFQHVALIDWEIYDNDEYLSLIHAYNPVGMVCQHRLDSRWQQRLHRIYSFPFI